MFDIFRSLPGAFDGIEPREEIREAIVLAAWPRIAGGELARYTKALRFEGKTLTVAVEGVLWRRQLKDLSPQMIFKLNSVLGSPTVRYIEFEVDKDAVDTGRAEPEFDAAELRKQALESLPVEVLMASESIADPELKKSFLLAAGACILRRSRA